MNVLTFRMKEVRPIIEHALSAERHIPLFSQTHKLVNGKWIKRKKVVVKPALKLIKDNGVYLISNGAMKKGETPMGINLIAYAEEINPKLNKDWFDLASEFCGGDDFAEIVPLSWFEEAIKANHSHIQIGITHSSIRLLRSYSPQRKG